LCFCLTHRRQPSWRGRPFAGQPTSCPVKSLAATALCVQPPRIVYDLSRRISLASRTGHGNQPCACRTTVTTAIGVTDGAGWLPKHLLSEG
jgi:hypothetical protein